MGGAIIDKSKIQSITDGSSTEAKFIAAHTAAKLSWYLQMLQKQLDYEQQSPTPIYIDNLPALHMIIILLLLNKQEILIFVILHFKIGNLMVASL